MTQKTSLSKKETVKANTKMFDIQTAKGKTSQ